MKLRCARNQSGFHAAKRHQRALTLVEMIVAMSIFGMVVVALISAHIFGLRQDELVNSKLGASDESRVAFNRLTSEIRSAKLWRIGNGDAATFTAISNGETQQGNALQLNFSTDTNNFVRYFFDPDSGELRRRHSGVNGSRIVAQYLTNSMFFRAEDYLGNVKTDLSYKYVIRVKMDFYQYQYPLTRVGPGYYYDRYTVEFKVTPHCPDGA